jgi:hypothetical protein
MAQSGIKVVVGDVIVDEHDEAAASTAGLYLAGTKVVGVQAAAIADVTPAADGTAVGTAFNTLLATLRTHGLIASS